MALRHTNPTQQRYDRKSGQFIEARAPYNFIPLPDKVVHAPPVLDYDRYHKDALSCRIDVELQTLSPTYIRGMMTVEQFERLSGKGSDKLTEAEKKELAPFFQLGGQPVIPGSSLRGMLRSIVEIVSFGHIRWVATQPTFTFRAVAAPKDDPLASDYQKVIGKLAANVRAGYLERDGEDWYVRPAKLPRELPGCEDATENFLKIKEDRIGSGDIPGFVRLSSPNYKPAWHSVRFEAYSRKTKSGKAVFIERIGGEGSGLTHKGVLVCSGNMAESGKKSGSRSKRTTHTVILERDPKAKRIKVSPQAIEDYRKGMTPFQEESLGAWNGEGKKGQGCLAEGAPVFYVVEGNEVAYFGHSPNFRIPMRLSGSKRAATPHDFVPLEMRKDDRPDFADALFGWVQDDSTDGNSPPGQRAGKVFIGDARYVDHANGIWLNDAPITPHTLASPKPTTFQHYLVQDKQAGHDPDNKVSLAHYGTPPRETQIRGFKRYWHKGPSPDILATDKEKSLEKQLTRIRLLKAGVRFRFRIYFENLHPAELGALLWALTLPGESGKDYAHKIGMGKPLGMGAVKLTLKSLLISDRRKCYSQLFDGQAWCVAGETRDAQEFIAAFERYVLDELGETNKGRRRLVELERIRMLLAMHEWPGPPASETRYMEIEHQIGGETINEYKDRPVLPDPLAVLMRASARATSSVEQLDPPLSKGKLVDTLSGYEKGTVVKFGLGPMQDFGFIAPDSGGRDVYVNKSKLAKGVTTLRQGQRVRFKRAPGAKGDQAIDVQVIG